ncbi:MAG: CPBP family intramembrane metalloprotease [Acholeplasmatales bacterium]|jgi:membrane protease YdiL (CAAX protease family)|nr:CPBP family intramembrane metalloprotease [Acholeplasmatales bacterium]
MADKNEQEIIDFDEEFKEFIHEEPQKITSKEIFKYIGGFLTFFARELVFVVLMAIIVLIPFFVKNYSEEETVMNYTSSKTEAIGYVLTYDITELDSYSKYLNVYEFNIDGTNAYIFVNKKNSFYSNKELTENYEFDSYLLEVISGNIEVTKKIDLVMTSSYFEVTDDNNIFRKNAIFNIYKASEDSTITNTASIILNLLGSLIIMVPLYFILKKDIIEDFNLFFRKKKDDSKKKKHWSIIALINIAIALAGTIALNFVINAFSNLINYHAPESVNQSTIDSLSSTTLGFIMMLVLSVVLAPIVEELVFRKSIFGLFKNKKYNWIPLIISSILFGLIHVTTELFSGDYKSLLFNGVSYIGTGLIFGYIYIRNDKNIWVNILAHAGYNFIAMILSILPFFIIH